MGKRVRPSLISLVSQHNDFCLQKRDKVVEKEDAKADAKAEKKKTPSRSARQEESEEKWDWEAAAESIDQQEVVNES